MTALGTVIGRGLASARPAAGTPGALYFSTDTLKLERDNGSSWDSASGNPMTTQDDLIVAGASGVPARLAKGTDGQVLTVDPSTHHLVWATPSTGFANPMTTAGDLIAGGSSGTPGRLAVGSNGQVLKVVTGAPAWAAGGGASIPTLLLDYVSATDIHNGSAISNGAWDNVGPSHSFTPTSASSLVEIAAGGMVIAIPAAGTIEYGVRLAIDLAGTPIYKSVAGTRNAVGDNILAGALPIKVSGLSAAAHTVQVQVRAESSNAGSLYCRSSSVPNQEVLRVQVTEWA